MRIERMLAVVTALAIAGCCKGKDEDPPPIPVSPPPKPDPTTVVTTTPVNNTPTATPTPISTPTPAGGVAYSPDGLPTDIPATRSSVPTVAEWDAVPREINVARSTPLNCETKMQREWLRVSCRPKSKTGGTPTNAHHLTGPTEDTYYYAKGGIASLVTRVVRGKNQVSEFNWTDKTQKLVIDWPHGNPRPVISFTD